MMKMTTLTGLLASLVLSGCGGGGGGGGGATGPGGPALVSISIDPSSATLFDPGDSVALTCTATYSDGSVHPITPAWGNPNPAVVSMTLSGGSALVTGLEFGTVQVSAAFQGKQGYSSVAVTDSSTVTAPGPVYALGEGSIVVYPSDGSDPVPLPGYEWPTWDSEVYGTVLMGINALVVNPEGTYLYILHTVNTFDMKLYRYDIAAQSTVLWAAIDDLYCSGLEVGPDGWLYTVGVDIGTDEEQLIRIHPTLAEVVDPLGSVGSYGAMGYYGGLTAAKSNATGGTVAYLLPIDGMGSPDGWLYRNAMPGGPTEIVALPPADVGTLGLVHNGGAVADRHGRVYSVGIWDNRVFRHVDSNSDGDFLDPGELEVFGTMPIVDGSANDTIYTMVIGISLSLGRSVVVNVQPLEGVDAVGLYWLRDVDPSANSAEGAPAEAVSHRSSIYAGWCTDNGHNLTTPR